jgi:hypothetical protein
MKRLIQGRTIISAEAQSGVIPVAGLVPATHVFITVCSGGRKAWMPGTSPGKGLLRFHGNTRSGR